MHSGMEEGSVPLLRLTRRARNAYSAAFDQSFRNAGSGSLRVRGLIQRRFLYCWCSVSRALACAGSPARDGEMFRFERKKLPGS